MERFLCQKGVGEMAHFPAFGMAKDLDDVEAGDDIGAIEHLEPLLGGADKSALFFGIHGFVGGAEGFGGAGFHFNKNQFGAMAHPADQIDFSAVLRAEIAVEDFVAGFFQETFGDAFAFQAELLGLLFT